MGYFSELPNLEYPSPFKERVSDRDYVLMKNIFRRVKLRDDVIDKLAVFDNYEVRINERPDTVANDYYEDPSLDWLVLISNNIVNVRDEWPLNDAELYDYASNKYGNSLNDFKFYETREVRDSLNRLVLPAGIVVRSDFTIHNPDNPNDTLSPVTGITNYEYEVRENDKKRSIVLLRSEYVQQAKNDIKEDLTYARSSQFINESTIKADNDRVKSAE
jgi:hypothetical protein